MKKHQHGQMRIKTLQSCAAAVLLSSLPSLAGSLNPTSAPAPTMRTLSEIYDRLDALTSPRTLSATTSTMARGYYEATDLKTVDPDLAPQSIVKDVEIFGLRGRLVAGSMPVGTIAAWHKDILTGWTLSGVWMECNGQAVNDPESPYHGKSLPNLNGGRYFLRGSMTSGEFESDAFQGHHHAQSSSLADGFTLSASYSSGYGYTFPSISVGDPISDDYSGTPRTASETRPVNMGVIWIMRIK